VEHQNNRNSGSDEAGAEHTEIAVTGFSAYIVQMHMGSSGSRRP
jgi:hypothetical protein